MAKKIGHRSRGEQSGHPLNQWILECIIIDDECKCKGHVCYLNQGRYSFVYKKQQLKNLFGLRYVTLDESVSLSESIHLSDFLNH